MTIQQHLNNIDYSFSNFQPSEESLKLISFISLINNGREENKSPLIHCKMIDKMVNDSRRSAIMAARGLSKSSLIEYLILYLACFNELGSIKDPGLILYVADSFENGVKKFRDSIETNYSQSEYLQRLIPNKNIKLLATDAKSGNEFELSNNDVDDLSNAGRTITDARIKFVNNKGQSLSINCYGVKKGIRGTKAAKRRPSIACHKKGTEIITNEGIHKVEEYSNRLDSRFENGIEVSMFGLVDTEIVTLEHRYMIASKICKKTKIHLEPQKNKNISMKGKTKSFTNYEWLEPRWVEAQDICINKCLGNQRYRKDYIIKPIDYSIRKPAETFLYPKKTITKRNKKGQMLKSKIEYVPKLHKHISNPHFWYLYGLYLSDGHTSNNKIAFTFDNNKQHYINVFKEYCEKLGYKYHYHQPKDKNCCVYTINDAALAKYHKSNHLGNSIKFIPEWVLYQPLELQKQLLLGYIAGDGYINYKNNQIRINSVNKDVINKLGFIAERLGLSYHIRWSRKKCFIQIINGCRKFVTSNKHWEIRFSHKAKEILGININGPKSEEVFIENGILYRKIKSIKFIDERDEFIPITTPSHTYLTQFGLSHNCLDDLIKEEDARSPTILNAIENIVYQSIPYALHPTKQKIIWVGTPFNSADPLYKAIESGVWDSLVVPICEKFPCEKKEFRGAWEDRFTYDVVKAYYYDSLAKGDTKGFYQELMMSIISDDDTLVKKDDIVWIDGGGDNNEYSSSYNYYITTDLAVSQNATADYSVISVFAYTSNEDFILVDGFCGKVLVDDFIKKLFIFVGKYKPTQVGIEVTGQQKGFVEWINNEQYRNNIYFNLKEIRPTKDKYSRFLTFAPFYHRKKIKFMKSIMMNKAYYNEFVDEISKVTKSDGFKSKHDDILDTHSMLQYLDLYAPSYGVTESMPTLVISGENYFWENNSDNFDDKFARDDYYLD